MSMNDFPSKTDIEETTAFILAKVPTFSAKVGLILGTGLNGLGEQLDLNPPPCIIPYSEIPHFATSTCPGHVGKLLIGFISGVPVMCMQGRFHYYEGYSLPVLTYPVRVMAQLGIKVLVVSNCSGCFRPEWKTGDIGLITDHINNFATNPLIGQNKDFFPPHSTRFPDMSNCYDADLREKAKEIARTQNLILREGVYFANPGPMYETDAERRLIQICGGDFAGASTAPEVIVARHCGIRVLGFTVMINMFATETEADHDEITFLGEQSSTKLLPLIQTLLPLIQTSL
ncbi:putative Purine nucleoside phosphorylase 1 [Blattamonas nauphoetae]|uniref:Purine nucleoside phosphorylase n=1 Tax=Blattamonas nauphoetae TaxID=2049346 RepID=A0ABQ9X4C6_9EUKA|nr:putative Purine nucleoside phosphorylase 1 [Blattamonas nauphoetae]